MTPILGNRLFSAVSFLFLIASGAQSQESETQLEALRVTTSAAKLYEFELPRSAHRKLKLHPDSILSWTNPVEGEVYGNVYVWTHDGRPEVIGSIFQWYSPNTHGSHEFHSLSTEQLEGVREEQRVWSTSAAGIELVDVPDRIDVAESQSRRARQMRAISRNFRIRKTDRADVSRELRMLAQPIFRYGRDESDVLSGIPIRIRPGNGPGSFLDG